MQSTFLHRHSSCRKLVSLSLVAAMAGCANPIVRWNVPPAPTDKAVALPYAKLYASAAREAYRNEIATQFHTTNNLGAGLIGLGSLVAALAAGSAHKDAILGATLIGGTAYGIGQWNLRPQRLLIYQAGVEGINCALTAVIPLSMSEADIGQLRTGLTSIETAMVNTASALSRAKTAFGPAHSLLTELQVADTTAALKAADDALGLAAKTLPAGRQLVARTERVGPELVSAVDRIAAAVDKALQATLPDLSSVSKIIGGLAGASASFAPGSGVEALITNALGKSVPVISAKGLELTGSAKRSKAEIESDMAKVDALNQRLATLDNERRTLLTRVGAVQARLSAVDSAANFEALKACGVADLPLGLKLSVDVLGFAEGAEATKAFVISGGAKPYVVELIDGGVDGLSVKGPLPFESRAQVSVKKAAKGEYGVLVMDSSAQMQMQTLKVQVGAAAPASGVTPPGKPPPPPTQPLEAIAQALNDAGAFAVTLGGKVISLVVKADPGAKVVGETIVLPLECKGANPQPVPTAAQVVREIVKALPEDVQAKLKDSPLGQDHKNLLIKADAACVKPK